MTTQRILNTFIRSAKWANFIYWCWLWFCCCSAFNIRWAIENADTDPEGDSVLTGVHMSWGEVDARRILVWLVSGMEDGVGAQGFRVCLWDHLLKAAKMNLKISYRIWTIGCQSLIMILRSLNDFWHKNEPHREKKCYIICAAGEESDQSVVAVRKEILRTHF